MIIALHVLFSISSIKKSFILKPTWLFRYVKCYQPAFRIFDSSPIISKIGMQTDLGELSILISTLNLWRFFHNQ